MLATQAFRRSVFLARRPIFVQACRPFSAQYVDSSAPENLYKPQLDMQFSGNKYTFYNDEDVTEKRYVPYPVKEATLKGGLYMTGIYMVDLLQPLHQLWGVGMAIISINYSYQVWKMMSNAVTKMELHNCGKKVTFTLGRVGGSTVEVNVKDIQKKEHERSLIETYEEPTLFPIQVGSKTYYVYGRSQEAIKHGEVFRAVVSGR
eukprot:CAMPEP_0170482538 /NCGR_PEP_ID=MMETSP0208-20121228/2513_1 /TAXON_ID=197538 /ORGANISM="Strombidium inclinatum, Strain S3" /LENGTH=203 /DNA_ID=CAMNT_0010755387 /DNA_START=11 /DNA_END=619 /DNA_ORIENTATION=-